MFPQKPLRKQFYLRDTGIVAKELLGKLLVRRIETIILKGIIVETEAYYGLNDPASRAYKGKKHYNRQMWDKPGNAFVYNVHKYWMFNIVAHESCSIGAVLIRSIEPKEGIDQMMKYRSVENLLNLTNGPGKLTIALKIDKGLNGTSVTLCESEIMVFDNNLEFEVGYSHRIGVTKDLEKKLRFFIKGSKFVSKKA